MTVSSCVCISIWRCSVCAESSFNPNKRNDVTALLRTFCVAVRKSVYRRVTRMRSDGRRNHWSSEAMLDTAKNWDVSARKSREICQSTVQIQAPLGHQLVRWWADANGVSIRHSSFDGHGKMHITGCGHPHHRNLGYVAKRANLYTWGRGAVLNWALGYFFYECWRYKDCERRPLRLYKCRVEVKEQI